MAKLNEAGINLIKHFESFSPIVYKCPGGYPTIGYGHRVKPHEKLKKLSEWEAVWLLQEDLKKFSNSVKDLTEGVRLNDNQFSALVSFAFNVGPRAFAESTLRKKLLKQDFDGAANEFQRWVYSKGKRLRGLIRRRAAEKELFLKEI